MESKRLCALLVLIITIESSNSVEVKSIDILNPIIRRSPARDERNDDLFGFSSAIHQLFSSSSGLTGEEALNQTVIMIGAPKGEFPGGLTGLEPNGLACRTNFTTPSQAFENDTFLNLLSDPDEIWPCYRGRQWGLVYQCSLDEDECVAPVGNGDPTSYDGLLFDRVGNTQTENGGMGGPLGVFQYKDTQLMGFSMYSTGEYFVACAPRWEEARYRAESNAFPRGRCVYSDRSLTNFNLLFPCSGQGATSRQSDGGYCQSGIGIVITDTSTPNIFVGSVGYDFSKGILTQYDDLDSPNILQHERGERFVEPASDNAQADMANFDVQASYYGYHLTTGSITATDSVDLISTSIRYSDIKQAGRVSIVKSVEETPTLFVDGEQFGEYFGKSVAAVDLNGDGYDDLVIGAPFYSDPGKAELGRIAIYTNQGGTLTNDSMNIYGTVVRGRFGYSITRMGDLNNDGYEDFAVSAPFEDSGVVYIYHGQAADDDGYIVNTPYQQKIEGKNFLSGSALFGSTLQALVDIDLNEYNDLVIGAPEGQAVVVLRTRPVARMSFSLVSVEEVSLDQLDCVDGSGNAVPCFDVRICAQYNGRGVNSFSAQFLASELLTGSRRRLFFINDGAQEFSTVGTLMFTSPNTTFCQNFTVYVSDTGGGNINDFRIQAKFIQAEASLDTPVFDFEPETVNVRVAAECGVDEICDSDLFLEIQNITYFTLNGARAENQSGLVAEGVNEIKVYLRYGNTGETAFTANISFSLPPTLQFLDILPTTLGIICEPNNTGAMIDYTCSVAGSVNTAGGSSLQLQWRPSQDIRGNESDISVPININIQEQSRNRETSNRLGNNTQIGEIAVLSLVDYAVTIRILPGSIRYDGNRPDVNNRTNNLGDPVDMEFSFSNNGPSTIHNGTIDIFIPARADETGDNFYYYPSSLTLSVPDNTEATVACDMSVLNPSNFMVGGNRRRRRSTIEPRSVYSHIASGLSRMARQTDEATLDCQVNPEACIRLTCSVANFGRGDIQLTVVGYLDNRFYYLQNDDYTLRTFARLNVLDDFTDIDADSIRENTAEISISPEFAEGGISSRDLALIIVLPIVGVVFIVILAVALYCFGFFRRKKHDKDEGGDGDEEFEAFDENAFSAKAAKKEKEIEAAK